MYTKLNFSFCIVYMFFLITFVFCFTSITKNNFDILGWGVTNALLQVSNTLGLPLLVTSEVLLWPCYESSNPQHFLFPFESWLSTKSGVWPWASGFLLLVVVSHLENRESNTYMRTVSRIKWTSTALWVPIVGTPYKRFGCLLPSVQEWTTLAHL